MENRGEKGLHQDDLANSTNYFSAGGFVDKTLNPKSEIIVDQ